MREFLERNEAHLGAHRLLQYQSEELSLELCAEVEEHLESCSLCAARLREMEAERQAFLIQHPPGAFLAALEARKLQRRPQLRYFLGWGGLLASCAAALLLLWQPLSSEPEPKPLPVTRLKAAVDLSFHVKSGAHSRLGCAGEVLQPGDQIQLRISSPQAAHLLVVSLDSRGVVTPFYDLEGHSIPIEPGVAQLLEGSVILDEALGPERIIACFSEEPLETRTVLESGRRALRSAQGAPQAVKSLDLPCAQASFLIHKRAK